VNRRACRESHHTYTHSQFSPLWNSVPSPEQHCNYEDANEKERRREGEKRRDERKEKREGRRKNEDGSGRKKSAGPKRTRRQLIPNP
jgi:hypothetical protein